MSSPLPIRPDPMPLREALRGLRHLLRRGGETVADTITTGVLPGPAQDMAAAILRSVEGVARNLDAVASGMAKTILGGGAPETRNLSDLAGHHDADARFGQAVYVALRSVLDRLGAPGLFVSEAAARAVFGRTAARTGGTPSALAAALTLDLLAARVLRGASAAEAARVLGAALEPVAIFAVLLWLQSARSEDENEAALDAATDLSVAIAADVARTCAAGDAGPIAALYDRYAPHV